MSNVFKRNEVKYLLTKEQRLNLENSLKRHMRPDEYGEYFVQNLYFDNDSWDVIRASLDKPFYKEKLRLRCYGLAARDAGCFLELKKKCGGVVYKRRADIPAERFAGRSVREAISRIDSQIARELSFYLQSNPVTERIYIGYNRTALSGEDALRVTLDTDIRFRLDRLDFTSGCGQMILPQGTALMEVKALGGLPLWLTRTLSENGVFPASFSKYGVCYTDYIMNPGFVPAREEAAKIA